MQSSIAPVGRKIKRRCREKSWNIGCQARLALPAGKIPVALRVSGTNRCDRVALQCLISHSLSTRAWMRVRTLGLCVPLFFQEKLLQAVPGVPDTFSAFQRHISPSLSGSDFCGL